MKTILIGHRGVGKSSFLNRIRQYQLPLGETVEVWDLDTFIEQQEQKTIMEIFAQKGESEFRDLELQYFFTLDQMISSRGDHHPSHHVWLAVGAGFRLDRVLNPKILNSWHVLWLQRLTDSSGRIFLNRPRLNQSLSAFVEYKKRYRERDPMFQAWAQECLVVQEGFDHPHPEEESWVLKTIKNVGGILTLSPFFLKGRTVAERFLKDRQNWGLQYFEVRDDGLELQQIEWIFESLNEKQILFSFRNKEKKDFFLKKIESFSCAVDWPLEWGDSPFKNPTVLSLHSRGADLSTTFLQLTEMESRYPHSIFKVAVPILSFTELQIGDLWQRQRPRHRSFLPLSDQAISDQGRWRWYRLWTQNRMPIQFWRESDQGFPQVPDQPLLMERLRQKTVMENMSFRATKVQEVGSNEAGTHKISEDGLSTFAAVLGDPVHGSRSPAEHFDFFCRRGIPFYPIPVTDQEWDEALPILTKMGLRYAAITSPLKQKAFSFIKDKDKDGVEGQAQALQAINTMKYHEKGFWQGTNTDFMGLRLAKDLVLSTLAAGSMELKGLAAESGGGQVAIWGGGGTLSCLRELWPKAFEYSAQTGKPRLVGAGDFTDKLDLLIWAVGRKKWNLSQKFPNPSWRPKVVLDLNYGEDSPGLEYAQMCGACYISGLTMFKAQACEQQKFWQKGGFILQRMAVADVISCG